MREDPPCIFLYYPQNLVAVHKRFNEVKLSNAGIGWNFNKWWVYGKDRKYKNIIEL